MDIERNNKEMSFNNDLITKMDNNKLKINSDSNDSKSKEYKNIEIKQEKYSLDQLFSKSGVSYPGLSVKQEERNAEETIPLRERHLPPSFWMEPKDQRNMLEVQGQNCTLDHRLLQHDRLTQQYISQYYGMVNQPNRYTPLQIPPDNCCSFGLFSQRLASLKCNSGIISNCCSPGIEGVPSFNSYIRGNHLHPYSLNLRRYESCHQNVNTSRFNPHVVSQIPRLPIHANRNPCHLPFDITQGQMTLQGHNHMTLQVTSEPHILQSPGIAVDKAGFDRGNTMAYPSPELILKHTPIVKPLARKSGFMFNRYHPYCGS